MKATVTNTRKLTKTGGVICGCIVKFADGRSVEFSGRMPKKVAIRQAMEQLNRKFWYGAA